MCYLQIDTITSYKPKKKKSEKYSLVFIDISKLHIVKNMLWDTVIKT